MSDLKPPKTLKQAIAQNDYLKREYQKLSEAYHNVSNDCATVLSNKDLEMRNKCLTCGRGRI